MNVADFIKKRNELIEKRKQIIKIEFEGYDEGYPLPIDEEIANLRKLAKKNKLVVHGYDVLTLDAAKDIKKKWNDCVKKYNNGKITNKELKEIEHEVGYRFVDVKVYADQIREIEEETLNEK